MNQPQVLLMTMHYRAPWCHSLKERRSEVKRLCTRLGNRFNISVVESGPQEAHSLFAITLAALCFGNAQADSIQQSILDFCETLTEAELYDYTVALL